MNTKTIFVLLASILATSASAQVTILPGGRGNLYIGNPTTLPGPANNVVISPRISLPAPLLTPSIALNPSPILAVAAATPAQQPYALPSAIPALPVALPSRYDADVVYHVSAARENAQPAALQHMAFAAASKDAPNPAKNVVAAREKLDNLFDNRRRPVVANDDERGPVRSDRHHSFPENELEKEIGAY